MLEPAVDRFGGSVAGAGVPRLRCRVAAAARDVLPPVRGEDDLPAYSTKIDVLALLDRRAAPQRGYYGSKAMVDDVGRTASLAADALRANLGAERQEAI
jgi:hypothetical protein